MITGQLPYQFKIKYIFVVLKIFFSIGSPNWPYCPFGTDANLPLQYVYQNDLNPKIGLWKNPGLVRISNNQSKSNGQ